MKKANKNPRYARRKSIRKRISGSAVRPRLAVFRSLNNISAQLIDDENRVTLVSASTLEKTQKNSKAKATCEGAKLIGSLIAERAQAKGVDQVVFDRGGFRFHGRVKALADAAREKGLKF